MLITRSHRGQLSFGFLESWSRTALAIVTAILRRDRSGAGVHRHVAAPRERLHYGHQRRHSGAFARSGRTPCARAISITSKYLIRVDGRHIFNPSNLGIVAMLVLAADTVARLSVQWGNNLLPLIAVWFFGAAIIASLGRFHITFTYVVAFVLFSFLRARLRAIPWFSEVAPITGPMYQLFIFFMITDPKTTVRPKWAQVLVAFLVAASKPCFA